MTWTFPTRITLHRPAAVALIATGAAGIFALDLFAPSGFAPWILYLWPIWMARWFAAAVAVPLVAAICASLALIGWALSPPGTDPVLDLLNRVLGVGLFGLAAAFFRIRQRLERDFREQAANLQAVVGHLYEGLITIDERGIVESFNPAAERMFGYAAADVIGRNVSLLMPETDRSRHDGYLADYLAGGPAKIIGVGREVTGKRKDGSVFPMELAVAETRLERGRVFIGSVRDVSERKRAEEALRTTSARLEFLLSSSPAIIYTCKCEGAPPYDVTFISASLASVLGYTVEEYLSTPSFWADHIHPDDRDRVFAGLPRLFAHGSHLHEYRFRHQDGSWRWMQDSVRVVPGPDGQPAELIGYFIDITERKQAEEALRSSRERFELAVRGTHDGLWDWDILTNENYWSDRWHELLGYRPGELVPSYDVWASLLHADDRERVLECARRHLDQRVPYDLEYRMRTKSGTHRWFHAKGQAVWNASGRPVRMAGSISDVTDRREAGEALDRAKRHLESLIHTVEGVVWEASAETFQFTFVSRKAEALLGYPVAQWYEQDFWPRHIHPDDRDAAVATCLKAVQDAGDVEFDYRMLAADGRVVWTRDLVSIVPERDGAVAIRGIMTDITERKRNEEALRESERFVRSTLDALSAHIAVLDETGAIVAVNEAWRRFAAENAPAPHNVGAGANYLAVCDSATGEEADGAGAFAAGLREVLQGRREEFALEYSCHSPAERRWFIGRAGRFREAGPVRVVVAHENITARKLLEDGLRTSQAQYQLLVEQAADIIYRTDAAGFFAFVNPVAVDIMQYTGEELLGLRFTDLIRPDCRRAADRFYGRQFVRKTPSTYYEFPALRKDGTEIWIGQNVQVLEEEGRIVGFQAVARDITERKRTEAMLQERHRASLLSAATHAALVQSVTLPAMLQQCADGVVQHLDAALVRIWLTGPGDLCRDCAKAVHCENRARCLHLEASAGLSRNLNGEYRRVPLGTLKIGLIAQGVGAMFSNDVLGDDRLPNKTWLQANGLRSFVGFPLIIDGEVHGVLASFARHALTDAERDALEVTAWTIALGVARKRAEETLRATEERWDYAFQGSGDGVWDWNAQTNHVFFSRRWKSMLGYGDHEIGESLDEWDSRVHPDDKAMVYEEIGKHFQGGAPQYLSEHRMRCKDGSYKWILDRGKVMERDAQGRPLRVVGTHTDITERKRLEDELAREHAELLRRTEDLAAANKELEAYGQMVSHDLRAPLQGMMGNLGLLQRKLAPTRDETTGRYLARMLDATKQMGQLITDLLAFAQSGQRALDRSIVNLDAVVRAVAADLAPMTEGRDLVWDIAPLPTVQGDEVLLRQVFANLLGNAVKYTRRCPKAAIAVGVASASDPETVIFVKDNGAGFDMGQADRLFGTFQRLHSRDQFEGTGIGLASVRRIIERHGGRVWAEGAVDRGATFYVSLPRSGQT